MAEKARKQVLGRGLGNLLDDSPLAKYEREKQGLVEIEVEKIRTNPNNPRRKFDQLALEELARTIKTHGLLQPVLVTPHGEGYMLVSGERRLRACRLLGLKKIPCVVKELEAKESLELSLIENIQREELDPIEEATVYQKLLEEYGLTQEQLAERVGKSRPFIANRIRLLQLSPHLQAALADGRVSEGQLRPLIGIKDEVLQLKLFREIEKHGLNARQVEELVRRYKEKPQPKKPKKVEDTTILSESRQLEEALGSRVRIVHNAKNQSGKIIVEYFSLDDFDRLKKLILSLRKNF
ncbi:MAG: ParB/RepB/Spo0J family partition protein [Leptospiraceae bacterium]|nr:ParB/RepB/Spo0J family partition protein [Leptospiraceae bacterium]MDW8305446.1 ParB/RepB/Spo0J family partition protein [Leptospiraceae bacterium]